MIKEKIELLEWVKHFTEICDANDIWYSVDKETLLGTKVFGGFLPWKLKFEVMMTVESYNKLKRLYRENVIDSFVDKTFDSFSVAFVQNIFTWEKEAPWISIRVIVPTTVEKANKYLSFWTRITHKLKRKRTDIKNAIDSLADSKPEGYFLLEKNFKHHESRWTKSIVFDLDKMDFEGLKVNVISNAVPVLIGWYGENYKKVTQPEVTYAYPAPLKKYEIDLNIDRMSDDSTGEIIMSHQSDVKLREAEKLKDEIIHKTMELSTVEEMNDFFNKNGKK